MPIKWSVDHDIRLVRVLATGAPTTADYAEMIAAIQAEGTVGYRSIVVSRGLSNVPATDFAAWAETAAARAKPAVSGGQIALIPSSDAGREIGAYFIKRLRGRRPCALFDNVADALVWLGLPPDTPTDPD